MKKGKVKNELIENGHNAFTFMPELELIVQKLIRDTLNYIPARVLPGVLGVISVAVFTRFFAPDTYGKYILIFTTTTLLTVIFSHWVAQAILRYRAQYVVSNRAKVFIRYLFTTLFLISVIITILAILLYPFFNTYLKEYRQYYVISLLIIIGNIWFNNLSTLFQSDLKSFQLSLYTILNSFLKFALSLFLILLISKNITFLLIGYLLSLFLVVIPMIFTICYTNELKEIRYKEVYTDGVSDYPSFLKQFVTYGFPMIGWFLGAELISSLDRYMLQFLRNTTEVGIYTCNYNLVSSAISLVAMPLLTAAHPLLMGAAAKIDNTKEYLQNMIKLFSRYFIILSSPILFFFAIYSKEFADIFLGADFRTGNIILPIIIGGLFIWCFAMFGHKGLEIRGKTNVMFLYMMLSVALKFLLNIIFIPYFGYVATAVSTVACFLFYSILVYIGTRVDIKWYIPWSSVFRVSIASAALSAVFLGLKALITSSLTTLIFAVLLTIPFYLIFLRLTNELTKVEMDYWGKIIKSLIVKK